MATNSKIKELREKGRSTAAIDYAALRGAVRRALLDFPVDAENTAQIKNLLNADLDDIEYPGSDHQSIDKKNAYTRAKYATSEVLETYVGTVIASANPMLNCSERLKTDRNYFLAYAATQLVPAVQSISHKCDPKLTSRQSYLDSKAAQIKLSDQMRKVLVEFGLQFDAFRQSRARW